MSGCWLWIGAVDGHGYGQVTVNGKQRRAHRVVFAYLVGEAPDGTELDHKCRVRCCVNPLHLEPVSHQVNVLRGSGVAARNAAKTHCPEGHGLTAENTYADSGKRRCKICRRAERKRYKARARDRKQVA